MDKNADANDFNNFNFNFPKAFSDKSLAQFITQIEDIPKLFSNWPDSFSNKLDKLENEGLFVFLNNILDHPIDPKFQLKILKFLDFLISSASLSSEYKIIFRDDILNKLILYQFDYSSEDILRSYFTVLKGISLKTKEIDPQHLLIESSSQIDECPLFVQAFQYVNHSDSIVVAAARHIVLNLCLIKYPPFQAYLGSSTMFNSINTLIKYVSQDGFPFFADFLNVCPLNIREYFILKLRAKLPSYPLPMLLRAAFFLSDTPARQMIIEILADTIQTLKLTDELSLGLVYFSLENKLLLLDSAIKFGFINLPEIPTFSKNPHPSPVSNDLCNQIKLFLKNPNRSSNSIECFALSIRCLEILYKDTPRCVKQVNEEIINELRHFDVTKLMSIFLGNPIHRIDCNIENLLDNTTKSNNNELNLIKELIELQSALCKWNKKKSFAWFSFPTLDESDSINQQQFPTSDGKKLLLSDNSLVLADGMVMKASSFYLANDNISKLKKSLDLIAFCPNEKVPIGTTNHLKKVTLHVEFASANVASSFETRIISIQKKAIQLLFDNLEY